MEKLTTSSTLAYRLRHSVQYVVQRNQLFLILNYPLKVIKLNASWQAAIETLSSDQFISLDDVIDSSAETDRLKTERFFEDLVSKGYIEREGSPNLTTYPDVSIIIPVRNRPDEIKTCVESLSDLNYPAEKLEIIVVDDASTDETANVVARLPAKVITMKVNRQAPFCRNAAVKVARGEILAFIDSDCLADKNWLTHLISRFRFKEVTAVGGHVDSVFEKKAIDRYEKAKSSLNMGPRFRKSSPDDPFFYVPSCNLLVRKQEFLELGGFSEDLIVGEDVDFCWRLQDEGHQLHYLPQGIVYHRHRNLIGAFFNRRFDYGTSEPLLQKRHGTRAKRMAMPIGAVLLIIAAIISALTQTPALALAGILPFVIDAARKINFTRKLAVRIPPYKVVLSVLRGYLAFYYHFCAFMSRYYLITIFPLAFFWPVAAIALAAAHISVGIVEYRLKKPRLSFPVFLWFFSIEQIGYQLGVWWGCVKNLNFTAVFPSPKMI